MKGANENADDKKKKNNKAIQIIQGLEKKICKIPELIILVLGALGIFSAIELGSVELARRWISQATDILVLRLTVISIAVVILCVFILFLRHYRIYCKERIAKEKEASKDFFIKDFLCIDMKFLETFMAQIRRGFVSGTMREKGRSISKIRKIFAGTGNQLGASFSNAETEINKEVRSMQQREEMLNVFLESKISVNEKFVKIIDRQQLEDEASKNTPVDKRKDRLNELIADELKKAEKRYICFKTYFDFISLTRLEKLTITELQRFYLRKKRHAIYM